VAKSLRLDHDFRGYIHLKLIPEASPELAAEAGLYADRVSINVELPRDESLAVLAPEKDAAGIKKAMGRMRLAIEDRRAGQVGPARRKFATGQSTQLIVGADAARDGDILARSAALYGVLSAQAGLLFGLQPDPRRQPPPAAGPPAPGARAPALPGRLADAVLRLRPGRDRRAGRGPGPDGRSQDRLGPAPSRRASRSTSTPPTARPCCARRAWAPGRRRILQARTQTRLTLDDVKRVCGSVKRAKPFIVTADWTPGAATDGKACEASLVAAATAEPVLMRVARLESEIDFDGWRDGGAGAAGGGREPEAVVWTVERELFSETPPPSRRLSAPRHLPRERGSGG
jgi:hypothetical protein